VEFGPVVDQSVRFNLLPSKLACFSLSVRGEGAEPQLRAAFSPAHPLAGIFHPPYPPIASQSISRDVPVALARAFRSSSPLVKGVAEAALYCAHRTSTVLSCAFCEQKGHLAAPSPSFGGRALREQLRSASLPRRPSSFCFRRRPIQFGVAAAVEAGEAVTGFASGIRHGRKGDGGVVERASGLLVEEMHFGHHGDRGAVPRWGRLFFAGNLLLRMTLFAFSFVGLDTGEMGGVVGDVHRSAAAGLGTGEMFVLEGLDKPTLCCPFLF